MGTRASSPATIAGEMGIAREQLSAWLSRHHIDYAGWLNRLLGALMACLTTLIVLGVVIVLFDTINLKFDLVHSPILDDSLLYGKIKDLAYIAFPYLKQLLLKQS